LGLRDFDCGAIVLLLLCLFLLNTGIGKLSSTHDSISCTPGDVILERLDRVAIELVEVKIDRRAERGC